MNPVYYFYHLCPNCGFCATKELFKLEIDDKKLEEKIYELKGGMISWNSVNLPLSKSKKDAKKEGKKEKAKKAD